MERESNLFRSTCLLTVKQREETNLLFFLLAHGTQQSPFPYVNMCNMVCGVLYLLQNENSMHQYFLTLFSHIWFYVIIYIDH